MAEYLDVFMSATRDGVPLRYKPTNAEKRVFKLRQGQVVKVFAKVEGESVTTGGKTLPGDWYLGHGRRWNQRLCIQLRHEALP